MSERQILNEIAEQVRLREAAETRADELQRERDEALDREADALELARGRGEAAVREANRAPEIRRAYESKLAVTHDNARTSALDEAPKPRTAVPAPSTDPAYERHCSLDDVRVGQPHPPYHAACRCGYWGPARSVLIVAIRDARDHALRGRAC